MLFRSSGTPTVVVPATNYTITANFASGNATSTISIGILPAPFYRWRFNGDYTSSTANVLTGTPVIRGTGPITTLNSSVFKEGNSSAFFDPAAGNAQYDNGGIIDLGVINFGNAFTISVWINTFGANPAYVDKLMAIISNRVGTGGNADGFSIFINSYQSSGDRILQLSTGNGSGAAVGSVINSVPLNQWCFLTIVADRTLGKAKLYVNGIPLALQGGVDTIHTNFAVNAITRIGHEGERPPDLGQTH